MLFKNIIGQNEIKERLINSVNEGRISHAQLFLGPEGSGNLALALAYLQYILCSNKQADDSCGVCSSCIKNAKMAHPDVYYTFPIAGPNKPVCNDFIHQFRSEIISNPYITLFEFLQVLGIENKQGIISAEESLEILKKLNLKAYEADYKVMLIWMPEKMNSTSANKLLKILEEPPEKTLFLLVAESQENMLRTVLSRTQLIKVKKINDEDIYSVLLQKHNLSDSIARQIAHLSDGNYNAAVHFIQAEESDNFYLETFRQWMLLCYSKKLNETIKWVDSIVPLGREVQKKFLSYGLRIIRESLLCNMGNHSLLKLSQEEQKFVTNFSKFIHIENTSAISDELNKAYEEIERNASPKILFLDVSFRLFALIKNN